jgi:hypothetical protein
MSCGMTTVPSPPATGDHEHLHLLCQMALELPLQDLVDTAVEAGWSRQGVLAAITEVADNLMLAEACNDELDQLLSTLRRK